ncbi:DUF2207 domain-containing protein [Desulfovibrio sp. TomC]|uniref:DUF2207 domain-containing protein n=1 Tax=Desulfovibrio sp. TomC TaxID=1562888 RepID=UPI0005752774|nr:DUF2207 domain-containing protein [Desulfovibrio sp. TomC]KHK04002.1 membrane-like protein [Desulfovibrio sp. TomC]
MIRNAFAAVQLFFALVLPAAAWAGPAAAAPERILSFDSRVVIAATADLTVTETIRVLATGASIRQGIVREFPTRYTTPDGKSATVDFRVLSVRRDGHSEDYHTASAGNGVNVYMGKKGVNIPPGEHVYELTYATDGQIGLFDGYDELYWNVTGNGWRLPIDKAAAEIHLPPGADIRQSAAYTGPAGAKGRDYTIHTTPGIFFCETTRPLPPGQGLTVAVAFPKGFITLPTPLERALSGQAFHMAAAGLAVVTVFFLTAWYLVGRDPKRGLTIPLFTPPADLSAPATRYVRRMGFDDKTFAAGLVEMAVTGGVTIEDAEDVYIVGRGKNVFPKGSWQRDIRDDLLGALPALRMEQENHARIRKARESLERALQSSYKGSFFRVNRSFYCVGAALSLLAFGLTAFRAKDPEMAGIFFSWIGFWTFAVAALGLRAWRALRRARARPRFMTILAAVFTCLLAVPFFIGEVAGLAFLSVAVSLPAAGCLMLIAALNALFWHLLKAPTQEGRRIMDALEGFRLYLSVGERERLELLNPPERTPELFERYLPYALALDVENAWADQFADVLNRAAAEGYSPSWYVGHGFASGDFSGFADNLGSGFSTAISSSATAPGSVSGSGGGGSSGGGGGGGGGGGW